MRFENPGVLDGSGGGADPACRACGGILTSDTISFGQALVPAAVIDRAMAATRVADLLLAVGSTLQVYPAAAVGHQGSSTKVRLRGARFLGYEAAGQKLALA